MMKDGKTYGISLQNGEKSSFGTFCIGRPGEKNDRNFLAFSSGNMETGDSGSEQFMTCMTRTDDVEKISNSILSYLKDREMASVSVDIRSDITCKEAFTLFSDLHRYVNGPVNVRVNEPKRGEKIKIWGKQKNG